jgi:hypothetical protein
MKELDRPQEKPLATIAAELQHEVEQAEQAWQDAVGHAIRAGELLIEAKAGVNNGGWLPWLEANFRGSVRSAQGYMRLARREDAQGLAHLGVEGALKQLAAPKPETKDEPALRRVQHEDVERDLRRLFVCGEWRQPGAITPDAVPPPAVAWAVLGVMLYHLNKAGAPADFGFLDLDGYVRERLPDVDNAWRGLKFEMESFERESEN